MSLPCTQHANGVAATTPTPRVLSIQSHVVHGYVGNKCAVFPLQLLGFDVDPIMSVQFSNHTGYPVVHGKVFDGSHLTELTEGLTKNELIQHSHLLTGYIGSLSLLQAIVQVAQQLKHANPGLIYVCDPVLGDEGKLYVKEDLIQAYKSEIMPLVTLLTPNQFEAELLTGVTIKSEEDALKVCEMLHEAGPQTVVMTSMSVPQLHPAQEVSPTTASATTAAHDAAAKQAADAARAPRQYITLVASTRVPQKPGRPSRFRIQIPHISGYFTGTGDLLTALLLAWTFIHPDDIATAVELAIAGLQGVLRATAHAAGPAIKERSAKAFAAKELRLIQNQHLLIEPKVELVAEPIGL
eukprot:jgi/Chrzof1/12571/UNPLg00524.t1